MYNNISEIKYIRFIYSVHEEKSLQHHIFSVILMTLPQPPLFNVSCPHFISRFTEEEKKIMTLNEMILI